MPYREILHVKSSLVATHPFGKHEGSSLDLFLIMSSPLTSLRSDWALKEQTLHMTLFICVTQKERGKGRDFLTAHLPI